MAMPALYVVVSAFRILVLPCRTLQPCQCAVPLGRRYIVAPYLSPEQVPPLLRICASFSRSISKQRKPCQ